LHQVHSNLVLSVLLQLDIVRPGYNARGITVLLCGVLMYILVWMCVCGRCSHAV